MFNSQITKMQENYNFETIISKWRRLSVVEQQQAHTHKKTVALASMSGDSSNHETQLKNKDDETLLAPEHSGHREWTNADAVAEVSGLPAPLSRRPGDLLNPDKEDDQQSTNDIDNKSIGSEALTGKDTISEGESKDKLEDKVDSVWLRAPSPHKRAPSASSPSDEGCGLTCLYYTLQCCDCILM